MERISSHHNTANHGHDIRLLARASDPLRDPAFHRDQHPVLHPRPEALPRNPSNTTPLALRAVLANPDVPDRIYFIDRTPLLHRPPVPVPCAGASLGQSQVCEFPLRMFLAECAASADAGGYYEGVDLGSV